MKPRRLALLGTVAALGVAVLAASPASSQFGLNSFIGPAQAAEAAATPPGFGDLVSKVKPAVISVRVRIDQDNDKSAMLQQNRMDSDEDSPFDQFSRQFGFRGPGGMNGMPRQRHQMITGEGSGFFISADGYAVTNNHVVDHAESVQVTMDDGTSYTAKVVGTDPKTDLALIKVDGKRDFPFVKFSDQKPRIGDWVVAVGNPFGLGGTVTAGIVSANGRDIGNGPYDDFIQIDAPINKGNSGGPAFDMNGNVIGVNTAIFSPSGGSVGIGFDIPASTAKLVVAQLKDKGSVTRGWLGVQVQPVSAEIADSLGLKEARGAIVDNPQDGSPAAKGRHRGGRRHYRRQRYRDQGLPRSRPHHCHPGAGHLREARRLPQRREQDGDTRPRRVAERAAGQGRRGQGAAEHRHAAPRSQPGAGRRRPGRGPEGRRRDRGRSAGTRRAARHPDRRRHSQRRRQGRCQCR
ncbi:S1-C subfamily serine protease [Bradyrhizobium sp. S3.14.4]